MSKLVFCGTPEFAVPTLNALVAAGHRIELVVSQPDRPSGRGGEISIPAAKRRALELGLHVVQPERIKENREFRAELEALKPEAIIVVAYGRIIPKWMLELPRLGNINLHASLLPKYRGAAPIQWAIANGESVTGATTMRLNEGLDTGPVLLQREVEILREDTAVTIAPRLAVVGADLMVETLRGLETGAVQPRQQDDSSATLAPILKKEDGRMDFSRTAAELVNRLRGFQPWPGAFTTFRGKQLQVHAAAVVPEEKGILAGALAVRDRRLLAGCAQRTMLELVEVQPEGKRRMSAAEFINGYKPKDGERLGP
jgi:methionyl-tRNA formyltransferase